MTRAFSACLALLLLIGTALPPRALYAAEPSDRETDCSLMLVDESQLKTVLSEAIEEELDREGGFLKSGAYKLYKKRFYEAVEKRCDFSKGPCDAKLVAEAFQEALESIHDKVANFQRIKRVIVGNTFIISSIIGSLYFIEASRGMMPKDTADTVFRYLIPYAMFGMAVQAPYTQKLLDHVSRASYRLFRGKKSWNRKHEENIALQRVDDNLKTTFTRGQLDALSRLFSIRTYVESKLKDALSFHHSKDIAIKNSTASYIASAALGIGEYFESVIDPMDESLAKAAQRSFTNHVSSFEERELIYRQAIEIIRTDDFDYEKYEETRKFYGKLLKKWLKLDSSPQLDLAPEKETERNVEP